MSRPTSIHKHLIDRRVAAVTRWHSTLTLKTESVAEHQFFVAEAASLICQLLKHYGIADPNELDTVTMARTHDKAEIEVGDIIGSAKRQCPILENASRTAELGAVHRKLFEGLPEPIVGHYQQLMQRALVLRPKDDLEAQIVFYCDRLAAYAFVCQEALLGNNGVRGPLLDRCFQELKELGWSWLVALREKTDVI